MRALAWIFGRISGWYVRRATRHWRQRGVCRDHGFYYDAGLEYDNYVLCHVAAARWRKRMKACRPR